MSPRAVRRDWRLTISLVMFAMLFGLIAPVAVRADANLPTITNTPTRTPVPSNTPIPPAPESNAGISGEEAQQLPPPLTETPIPSVTPTYPPGWQQPFTTDSNAKLNRILIVVIFLAVFMLVGIIVFWLYLNTRGRDHY